MKYTQRSIKADKVYFVPLSDVHIGDKNANIKLFQEYIDWIKERDNVLVFLNGDMINLATTASASSVFEQVGGLDWQIDKAVQMLYPIKDKIIGCITGNHEERLEKFSGFNPTTLIATRLNIPYLKYSAVLDIEVQSSLDIEPINYIIYCHHTTGGGGNTVGGKMNRVDILRKLVVNADLYVGSHNHHLGVMPVVSNFYNQKLKKVEQVKQILVDTGSFLNWDDGYAEYMQLTPSMLGAPKIILDGTKHDIHVSI